jgi:uncharacterized protein YndB with AHSA1/START domain
MKPNSGKLKLTTTGDCEIAFTREFDGPRKLVFAAFTKPAMVQRWLLGPGGWTMPVCEIDLRVGGKYRYVWRHSDGREMGMGGVYCEIAPPERMVFTEKFDHAWYPGEALITVELRERDGKTTLTELIRYESRKARDGVLQSGMRRGVVASYDRLEKILATRRRATKRGKRAGKKASNPS